MSDDPAGEPGTDGGDFAGFDDAEIEPDEEDVAEGEVIDDYIEPELVDGEPQPLDEEPIDAEIDESYSAPAGWSDGRHKDDGGIWSGAGPGSGGGGGPTGSGRTGKKRSGIPLGKGGGSGGGGFGIHLHLFQGWFSPRVTATGLDVRGRGPARPHRIPGQMTSGRRPAAGKRRPL